MVEPDISFTCTKDYLHSQYNIQPYARWYYCIVFCLLSPILHLKCFPENSKIIYSLLTRMLFLWSLFLLMESPYMHATYFWSQLLCMCYWRQNVAILNPQSKQRGAISIQLVQCFQNLHFFTLNQILDINFVLDVFLSIYLSLFLCVVNC